MREIEWRLPHWNRPYGSRDLKGGRIGPPHQLTSSRKPTSNRVNPRPAGGAFERPPPLRFFEDSENMAARSAAGFLPPYPPSFPQLLWKFRPKAMWGQVTRSGQVTQLQNNFPIAPRPQCFRESYEPFGIWWGHQCLQNVYLGFLISVTSGQVILRPPHYKSVGKKSTPLYLL